MSRNVYLLRHGTPQTDGVRRYVGTTDLPLSEEGEREAQISGAWLRENAKVEVVYSSPLRRAWETARRTAEVAGLPEPIPAPELREIHLGAWENRPMEEVRAAQSSQFEERGAHPWSFRVPGGETFAEAAERFLSFLNGTGRRLEGDILIVSHAGVMRAALTELMGWPRDDVLKVRMPMAGLSVLEEDGERWRVLRAGFLPDEALTDERVEALYRRCETPQRVIRHMRAVHDCAGELLEALGPGFHRWRILRAALVHDILRTQRGHAKLGAELLRRKGYDEIADLVAAHQGGDFDPDAPLSDSDILWCADKLVMEDRRVSMEERFAASREGCKTPKALEAHERRRQKALNIGEKLRKRGVRL